MLSDAGSTRKRLRTEDENGEATPNPPITEIKRDEKVWLADGNIIVVAADTVAFRVHKSILSLRSGIFGDLFSLPNADEATMETMDWCPVVRVSDSPDDIRRLFLVLCCGKNYYYDGDALIPVSFEVLASLIRMGHKYALQDILDHALSRLKKYYTDSFREWKDPTSRALYVTTTETDAPTVIELARLTNTPRLLPTAFLACTTLATRISETEDPDGEIASAFASTFSSLAAQDQMLLVEAMTRLTAVCSGRLLHLIGAVPCQRCTSRDTCTFVREAPLLVMHNGGDLLVPPACGTDALEPVAEMFWCALWKSFCEGCRATLVETDDELMEMVWNCLPELFRVDIDLDEWNSGSYTAGTNGPDLGRTRTSTTYGFPNRRGVVEPMA